MSGDKNEVPTWLNVLIMFCALVAVSAFLLVPAIALLQAAYPELRP